MNYQAWHTDQEELFLKNRLKWKPKQPIEKTEVINIIITFPDNIKADLTNKAESLMDFLVDMGVLADDNHFNCSRLTLTSGGVDKLSAGAQIEIIY